MFGGIEPKPPLVRITRMNARRRLLGTTLGAVAAAAALTGCAGGGSAASPLPRGDFIKRADAICLAASRAENRLAQPASPDQRVAYVRHVYSIERGVVHDLRRLAAPAGDERTIARMLDQVDMALALQPQVVAAAGSGTQSQINDAQAGGARYLNAAKVIASRYGFKACGA
jgi:hypothetical protein